MGICANSMARGTSDGKLVERSTPKAPKPSVRVTEDDLPAIKSWTVGKKYQVTATVEMRGHSKGDRYGFDDGKKKHEADLVIHKIEARQSKTGDGSQE